MANTGMLIAASLWLIIGPSLITAKEKSALEDSLALMSKQMGAMLNREWDISKVGNAALRNIIKNALPRMNTSLDPLEIEGTQTLDMLAIPGLMDIEYAEFRNVEVTNLKSAHFAKLSILPSQKVLIDLEVPELKVAGEWYNIRTIVGDLIPFYGFGDFNLSVSAGILVNVVITKTSRSILQMSELEADLILHQLKVHFSNLMDGHGDLFNELISEKAGEILDLVKPALLPDVISTIQTTVNDFLLQNEMTMNKLMQCMLLDKCFSKSKYIPILFPIPL